MRRRGDERADLPEVPSCQAEEPLKVRVDLDRLEAAAEITQRCTVCWSEVLVSEATTYIRQSPGPA